MILAYLLLLTGLTISAVAIYYSVVGLTAIFSAAAIPIIIMGSALEVGKLVCASWLKANWERAPRFIKYYMIIAVVVLMIITSMGIFGFLSKAHNDQTLVSGDVGSKIAIYDEKIKTAKENIESDRKQLKQMDEAVDQVMARSSDEKGAEKANAIRKNQSRDRIALAKDIEANQKLVVQLNDEAAPIRAEVRKVEAEVGPIKYIAAFIYGTTPDESMLEKAVTWIIILIVIVFDPLAVIMLLAAQMTFGWTKEQKEKEQPPSISDFVPQPQEYIADEIEPAQVPSIAIPADEIIIPRVEPTVEYTFAEDINEPDYPTADSTKLITEPEVPMSSESELEKWNKMIAEAEAEVVKAAEESAMAERLAKGETYIDGEGVETVLPETVYSEDDGSKKKTYMIKDPTGQVQTKNRE
jgi:flagellar basal body-associated protein FliL